MMIKKINLFRKRVFLKLTGGLGQHACSYPEKPIKSENIKRILVIRPNHRLGNLLLVTALIKELEHTFPEASIDILAKGKLAKIIYKNYSCINHVFQLPKKPFMHPLKYLSIYFLIKKRVYDLAINAVSNSSSGRIFTSISQANIKITDRHGNGSTEETNLLPVDFNHIAKQQIYKLRSCVE